MCFRGSVGLRNVYVVGMVLIVGSCLVTDLSALKTDVNVIVVRGNYSDQCHPQYDVSSEVAPLRMRYLQSLSYSGILQS